MDKASKYKGGAFEAIHRSAAGMLRAGTIDEATMRYFDESCLTVLPALDTLRVIPGLVEDENPGSINADNAGQGGSRSASS